MTNLSGSLSYRKDSNSFFINETGTNDGWVPLPISVNAKDLSNEDLRSLAERLGGGSKYQIYVDVDNPNASDSKDNNGISKLTPFKSIERALLEVARRSFRTPAQEQRLGSEGDIFERYTINLAPGEYTIQNTPGGFASISNYPDYQIASNLIQRNRDWIVAEAFAQTTGISGSTEDSLLQDLSSWVISLASDLSSLSNGRAILNARDFLNPDKNIVCTNPSSPPNNYFVGIYTSLSVRQQTVLALQELRDRSIDSAKNLGFITDPDIIINPSAPAQVEIYNKITELTQILIDTLQCVTDPRFSTIENFGLPSIFPESGEPTKEFYSMFNAASRAGVILPRGVSIVGVDLRKVKIRPAYVPDYTDPLSERGAIFKMTGANFFSGFTIKDKIGFNQSHHMLTAFEFSSEAELEEYYEKVRLAFSDKSIYHRAQDAANLLEKNLEWVSRKAIPSIVQASEINYATVLEGEIFHIIKAIVSDLRALDKQNIYNLGKRFHLTHILPISDPTSRAEAQAFYKSSLDSAKLYIRDAINNEANPAEGGVIDESIIVDTSAGARCADVVSAIYSYVDILKNHIDGLYTGELSASEFIDSDVDPFVLESSIVVDYANDGLTLPSGAINGVTGASPYIFSASLRSEWGMCGIDGDGSKVRGLKSYLAAQFTVISLQRDSAVFVIEEDEVGGFRYIGSRKTDPNDYRHFGYRVTNAAYSQLVSCFCICPAVHYWADTGAEFSITNSTSNFGDISLYSEKFLPISYPQDKGLKLIGVIKPKFVDYLSTLDPTRADNFILGNIESFDILIPGADDRHPTEAKITLSTEARWLDTYNITNPDRTNKVYLASAIEGQERSGRVKSVSLVNGKTEITIDTIVGSWPTVPQSLPIGDPGFIETYDSVVIGRQTYIKRFIDPRSATDRQYRLILGRDLSLPGKRKPVVHYVLTQDGIPEVSQPFNTDTSREAFYIVRTPVTTLGTSVNTTNHELYDVKIGALRINDLGSIEFEADLDFNSRLDLDYDPTDPLLTNVLNKSTVSKTNIENFLSLLGITGVNLTIDSGSQVVDLIAQGKLIKSNKPSIIRCGGQTWEYMGYYNYSTGIPFAQTKKVGENLSESLQKLKRIEKTQTYLLGGRIYATGMDEEGNSYVGNTFQDLKTGETEEIIRGSSVEVLEALQNEKLASQVTFTGITIAGEENGPGGSLNIENGSTVSINESNIIINNSTLDFQGENTFLGLPRATEDEFGVVRVATRDELKVEKTSGEEPAFVTPEGLRNWRVANKIVSQISTSNIVYVSNDPSGKHTLTVSNSLGAGNQVTYAEFKAHNDNATAENQWQLSDNTKDSFRCLSSLKEVSLFIDDNLTQNDVLTLYIDPGKYLAGYTFNCALTIYGANNKGPEGWGNPDGTPDSAGYKGVILYNSYKFDRIVIELTPDAYRIITTTMSINSTNASSISFVHFWSPQQALESLGTITIDGFKSEAVSGIEVYLQNINTYLRTIQPANFPYTNYNWLWEFGTFGFITFTNNLSIGMCTFGGSGGLGTLFTALDDATLSLTGVTFRGNEHIKIDARHVKRRDVNGNFLQSKDGNNKIIPSNFYESFHIFPNSSWFYNPITDTVDHIGFWGTIISIAETKTLTLNLGGSFVDYPSYFGTTLDAPYTTGNDIIGILTINNDLKNIRLEKNINGNLFSPQDNRVLTSLTSESKLDPFLRLKYRGTDSIGEMLYGVSFPSLTDSTNLAIYINKIKNQGPIINSFIYLQPGSSLKLAGYYEGSIWTNRDTSDLIRSQGFLGSFGISYVTEGSPNINLLGIRDLYKPERFAKGVEFVNPVAVSNKLIWSNSYHKNLFYPAWKGFSLGRFLHPVIVDLDSGFSTFISDINLNHDYSICKASVESKGFNMNEIPPYTEFLFVGTTPSDNISVLYLGHSNDLLNYYFVPFTYLSDSTLRSTYVSAYLSAKTNSRVFNTPQELTQSPIIGIQDGDYAYIVSSNLLLRYTQITTLDSTDIQSWTYFPSYNTQSWQAYGVPHLRLITHNLNQLGIFNFRLSNGFKHNLRRIQSSTYDVSDITVLPTDLGTLYSNISYPTSIYPTPYSDNVKALLAYLSAGNKSFESFEGFSCLLSAENGNDYHTNMTI